jgi:hypothetical protein
VASASNPAAFANSSYLVAENQARGSYLGVFTESRGCCESMLTGLRSTVIPSAETRWVGNNRSRYSNSGFDRLIGTFTRSIQPSQRETEMTELSRILTDDAAISSFFT